MSNQSGNAYGLTALIPIKNGSLNNQSYASLARQVLQQWPSSERSRVVDELSPMAKVPNTYLCRFYILNDVFYEGSPAKEEHLKSKYLVFSSNFHGSLETYLQGMWNYAQDEIQKLLCHCVAFERVKNANDFVDYIKGCQVDNALFFNGSTDDSLAEQLKSLYLKQAFSHFVFNHQTRVQQGSESAADLQKAFQNFVAFTQPSNLQEPTWSPGVGAEPEGIKDL